MTSTATFSADPDVVACELNGGAALLDLRTSTYFSLNPVGAVIWEAIQQPKTLDGICATVAGTFEVGDDRCRADVQTLLDTLQERRLAVRNHAG